MKIRIVSDGTPSGSSVETEDGKIINYIESLEWSCSYDGVAKAKITFSQVSLVTKAVDCDLAIKKSNGI